MARPNGSIARAATTAPPRNGQGDADHGAPREPEFAPQWPGFPPPPVPSQQYAGRNEPPMPALDPAYQGHYGQDRSAGAPTLPDHGYGDPARDPYGEPTLTPQAPADFDRRREGGYGHGADPRTQPHSGLRSPSVAPQFEPFAPQEHVAQAPTGFERFAPPPFAASQAGWPPPQPADQAHYPPLPQGGYANGYYPDQGYPAQQQADSYDPAAGYQPAGAQQWQQGYDWQQPAAAPEYALDANGQPVAHNYLQQDPYANYAQPEAARQALPYDRQPAEGDYAYDDAEADVPERSGPRPIVIIGALLGAILLGGGMAYGYKTFIGSSSTADGRPPVLRADSTPAKARPTDPGGRTIAHTDKKFLNRLAEDRTPPSGTATGPVPVSVLPPASAGSPREVESESGPRKVTTVIVNRDGSIDSPAGSAPLNSVPSVPGMLIDGLRPVHAAPREPAPIASPPPLRQSEPPPQPVREAAVAPPAAPPRVIARAPATPAEPRAPRRPATREAAAPATTAATGRGGYVAVLASRRSRMDALKAFADMQQKYGTVLQSKTPDVREVNLGAKGVWYRVLVGPAGGRDVANGVCSQLKSQGFTGCWISAN